MDFENFRLKYVSGLRPFAISTPVRLLGAIALMLAVCGMGGRQHRQGDPQDAGKGFTFP